MSQDQIDEAIDAVVRAVDRIERATRDAGVEAGHSQAAAPSGASAPTGTPAQSVAAPAGTAEFYELVGRLVAKAQELDGHLAATSELRAEVVELVARVAAASGR